MVVRCPENVYVAYRSLEEATPLKIINVVPRIKVKSKDNDTNKFLPLRNIVLE